MVKVLFLGLLVAMMCGLVSAVPAPQLARSIRPEVFPSSPTIPSSPVLEDPATRSERSTNLSYITGTARKIQLFIKNRHLQLLSDGTVNGTSDAYSAYTVFQRMSVAVSKLKIQGVATCHFLCMNSCGLLYGAQEFGDECVFNENIEPDLYNTYSSAKYSNGRRTYYLALNRLGQPRRLLLRALQPLGALTSYVRVLILTVKREVQQTCASNNATTINGGGGGDEPFRCRRRKKMRKPKKKKCAEGELTCHNRKTFRNDRFKFRKKKKLGGAKIKKRKYSRGFKYKKTTTSSSTEVTQDYETQTQTTTTHWEWDATTEEFSTSYTD